MKAGSRRLAGLAVLLASAWVASCQPPLDRIGDILARPSEFSDRAVVVEGRVTKAVQLPFVNQHVYFLNDGSGEIAVVTTRDVPQRDATVRARGTVNSAATIVTLSLGLFIREDENR
jgi:hypothetical protein